MKSIRSQLLTRLIIASIILVGGTAWFAYQDVRDETRELFDAQLARSARLVLSLAQTQDGVSSFSRIQEYLDENGLAVMYINFDAVDEQETQQGHAYESKLAFQIWDNEGNLVVKSYNAPLEPIAMVDSGFSNTMINGRSWRTFSLKSSDQQYRCITAERIDVRNDLIFKIDDDLFYLLITLVPALSLIMYISITHGLKPLESLTDEIDNRSGDNLSLITNDAEITDIVTIKNALNQLLHRLKETLAREKRITSDAAHELRTPLAAIRLHTELARGAKNHEQQDESLKQVILGVDRTTHLVEQLLTLARLEPDLDTEDFHTLDLTTLIAEECALLSPLAIEKNIDITFNRKETTHIHGNESTLRLLIRNLLTNAIVYSFNDGTIDIELTEDTERITFTINDSGPGIPEQDRQRVLERFYRLQNHAVSGCGIGLSIVDRVVQIHHGKLRLSQADSGQGLKVIVTLPLN